MNKTELNYCLFKTAEHLTEAAKHISNLSQEKATSFMLEADAILSVIVPEEEKVSEEKLDNILDEIMNFGVKNDAK